MKKASIKPVCAILIVILEHIYAGQVILYPSESVSACSGDQLEFRCTAGEFLEWRISVAIDGRQISRILSLYSEASQLQINSTMLAFSRVSVQGSLPLISRLLITPVHADLNGTEVNCIDVATSNSSLTRIYVISEDPFHGQGINVSSPSEQFESNVVTVALEWIAQEHFIHSYNVIITPQPAFTLKEATSIQFQVFYNTVYNVSIIGTSLVCRKSITTLIGLHYANCRNPLSNKSVTVMGYIDPALPGSSVLFRCPPTLVLTGPNSSTCMGNGQWEPDPRMVACNNKEMQTQQDKGIAIHVASSLTVFTLTSILFFTAGYLCRHSVCQKPKKRHAAETSAAENCTCSQHGQINTHNTPKLHALKFDLSANVAYASVLVQ